MRTAGSARATIGYMRTADDVVYLNRMGDVLRLGGFLVAPREVEDLLITLPGIGEAQFVAAQGPRGLVPVAFVVLDPAAETTFDEDAVLADCSAVLATFKVPKKRVIPLDEFPTVRGANGDKIQRNRLREMAEDVLPRADPLSPLTSPYPHIRAHVSCTRLSPRTAPTQGYP